VIGPSGNLRVLVATKPVDFFKGADGLAHWCAKRCAPTRSPAWVFRAKRARPGEADLLGRHRRRADF
jgi:hypothetical protein